VCRRELREETGYAAARLVRRRRISGARLHAGKALPVLCAAEPRGGRAAGRGRADRLYFCGGGIERQCRRPIEDAKTLAIWLSISAGECGVSGIDFAGALNREQLAAVAGRMGGPGAGGRRHGKTRTLVYRVAWLVEHGVSPTGILLLTFTNRAAGEMLEGADPGGPRRECGAELFTTWPTGSACGTGRPSVPSRLHDRPRRLAQADCGRVRSAGREDVSQPSVLMHLFSGARTPRRRSTNLEARFTEADVNRTTS